MNVAIVAITRKGVKLGRQLSGFLPASHLYLPAKFASGQIPGEHHFQDSIREVVGKAFLEYEGLVLIMAAGIAVRTIATRIKSKHHDPAVVVIDEAGKFAVSLLSGHRGGANELAAGIASHIGAQPVVTTASEVSGTIAVDMIGQEFGWQLDGEANVTKVSAAMVNGDDVGLYQDAGERHWWTGVLSENIRNFSRLEDLENSACPAALIITDKLLAGRYKDLLSKAVIYRPKCLVIGIGCNRGVICSRIEEILTQVLLEHGLSAKSIRNIATIDLKRDEEGLLEFARKQNLSIEFFKSKDLKQQECPSEPSDAALKAVGAPGVCEPAALLSSGSAHLVVPKNKCGDLTIAIARVPFSASPGKLSLIGIGPGDPGQMTFKAREVLLSSDVVVGYKTYVEQIKQFLSPKEVFSGGMGGEVERMKKAISLAEEGKAVAVVCGGDAGIYGMAGLVGEIVHQQGVPAAFEMEVIPGVPSLAAVAALLGAPLTHDFASISLSDYLIPWTEIIRRLELAAQGDFVLVIYNPKSKQRPHQLTEAMESVLRYRPGSTPVGIVTNGYRQGEQITLTDLEHMLNFDIGMSTTVIIGNSTTFTFGNWMVTPRGYGGKYNLDGER